ncbi:hypothetical protein [Mycolicibacterium gadium]|uniref:HNH endonuclease n=1 Tax=Mycolicibacterium gadium TaxID=1794 RepID=A0ABT6GVF6_MYCGU|nr:hypothetical protein [Mycolicibacterium gadium]MDG5485485.1 hypothetical protein [Mycolicibacterium gadium]
MHADSPQVRREWVTSRGLEMLDELVGALQECQLALKSMRVDVGLTLDELERDLRKARESASLAYGAASLLDQAADLARGWTDYPSRPKAIFARHRVAADYGAPSKTPAVPTADRYEETLRRAYKLKMNEARGAESRTTASGRRCGTYLGQQDRSCRQRVARIGHDVFAEHCPDHLDDAERELYEHFRQQAAMTVAQAHRDEFRRIADQWIEQRLGPRSWVEQVIRSTGWTG